MGATGIFKVSKMDFKNYGHDFGITVRNRFWKLGLKKKRLKIIQT